MKNKILSFTYTKDSGDVSTRKVITISEPTDLLMCFDISEFDSFSDQEKKEVLAVLEKIEKVRLDSIYNLADYYGIRPLIKTFKNKGITGTMDHTARYKDKK